MTGSLTDDLVKATELLDSERFVEALDLLSPHADAGVTEAESLVGVLLMTGARGEPDFKRARQFLESAATKGDGCAAHNLGTLCVVDPDCDSGESRKWYDLARSLGYIVSQPWP